MEIRKKYNLAVIGSGFAGLAASAALALKSNTVHVFEKNAQIGGRARQFHSNGFMFDMGPSWYWMPDVLERFYNQFGYTTSDFYELKKLDPGFRMVFGENEELEIPAGWEEICDLFENIEEGAGNRLQQFMKEAEFKYNTGINNLVYQPALSFKEFLHKDLITGIFRLQVFSSLSKHVRKYFSDPKLILLMEFPILFLGAMPQKTPALYSLMNYAGLKLGTYYPIGGFGKVVSAMKQIAEVMGVKFHTSEPVTNLLCTSNRVTNVITDKKRLQVDGIIGAADYHHIEQKLLPTEYRNYNENYWKKRTFAPSCLLFYLGIDKKINKLAHHTLFFDGDFSAHAIDIYVKKQWPTKPTFYVCCPSKTDPHAAPENMENLFVLMPVSSGIQDTEGIREKYEDLLLSKLEKYTGEKIRSHIIFKKTYCINDFENDYNAYKGNAYGLANTLRQTAHFRPKIRNRKVKNLFYAGQLTVPGPGMPPSIISGQVSAHQLLKQLNIHV